MTAAILVYLPTPGGTTPTERVITPATVGWRWSCTCGATSRGFPTEQLADRDATRHETELHP